jgi:hypothetical protein
VFTVRTEAAVTREAKKVGVDIDAVLRPVLVQVGAALASPATTITIKVAPKLAIPQVGVNGFANPGNGLVTISLDPNSKIGLATTLRVWLPVLLANAVNKSARVKAGPGFGSTLLEHLVSQGLSDEFGKASNPAAPPIPWANALSPAQEHDAWGRAQSVIESTGIEMDRVWFFGAEPELVPFLAGFTIGARIVSAYRAKHAATSWHDLTRLPARDILAGSGYKP